MLRWQGTLTYCLEDRTRQNCQEEPLVVQKGHPCFLNSFSERIVSVAGSTPGSRLGQVLIPKGL